ncbi:MAG TPA: CRISPR system precrRNA processing endoribonuclease RAMP protein Cas6 [Ktedonobacteraceae bacterium]|jgi:CRISPR-associated endoribonuclease Cas6|nr:CRISPR system precrRNA processing endoribonuclease RAMP protein Cas6 [Ktedonobacteraceae bacterium]
MDIPLTSTAPSRLYAFLLKLRPIQEGTLMPFSGELVHAAWLHWIRAAAPEVAEWLHEGNKRRLFTCSSLQFPLSPAKLLDVEQNNIHWPLLPEKTYTIRITLLLGELFPLFYQALTDFKSSSNLRSKPPFIRLGKQSLLLEEVILEEHDLTGWTGFTSFTDMVERVRNRKTNDFLKFEFDSITSFNRGNAKNRAYGNYMALLPLPHYVFPYLARRWQDLAPAELAHLVNPELIEQYALDEGIVITDYYLRPHVVKFTTHWQHGFIGMCKYQLRGPDEPATQEDGLTLKQQVKLLGELAFYTGVGYKTTMGMGRGRVI